MLMDRAMANAPLDKERALRRALAEPAEGFAGVPRDIAGAAALEAEAPALARGAGQVARRGLSAGAVLGGASAVALAPFVANVLKEEVESKVGRQERAITEAALRSATGYAEQLRQRRMQSLMAVNEAKLLTNDPHLYAELAAGRKLAPGDVFIGGQPDRSLIESVVRTMSGA